METKNVLIAGSVGAIVLFILGYLAYGIVLANFFDANVSEGVMREQPEMGWLIAGHFPIGILLAYVFSKWAGITTFSTGATAGGIIGLLMSMGYNFIAYGTETAFTIPAAFVDIAVQTLWMAIAGGIVAIVLGKLKSE